MPRPTPEEIEAARTPAGGWTREQLSAWGVPWPPPKGWKRDLLGEDENVPEWQTFSRAVTDAVHTAAEAYILAATCESPIEVILGAQLAKQSQLHVTPQFKLGRFRYDFAIQAKHVESPIILIECDGKAFHSTPAQVANDRLKDEAAAAASLTLVRFTGSEIHRDAKMCALIAIDHLLSAMKMTR